MTRILSAGFRLSVFTLIFAASPLLAQKRRGSENQCKQGQPEPRAEDAVHCFCSLLGVELDAAEAAAGSLSEVVWAPWATSSFLISSDVPTGIVKIAPCRPPSASRY